jgi:hypothetical protein
VIGDGHATLANSRISLPPPLDHPLSAGIWIHVVLLGRCAADERAAMRLVRSDPLLVFAGRMSAAAEGSTEDYTPRPVNSSYYFSLFRMIRRDLRRLPHAGIY